MEPCKQYCSSVEFNVISSTALINQSDPCKRALVFIRCVVWLGITDQHCALIVTPLFITQAATCFGIHMPSSGSVLYPCELLEGRNGYVVVMYCKCWWAVCTGCSFVRYYNNQRTQPTNIYSTWIQHNRFCLSSNSQGYRTLPEDGKWMPKHVGAWVINKAVTVSAQCWSVIPYPFTFCITPFCV
jgi:hypothetical protein